VNLRALTSKRAEEVANHKLNVFLNYTGHLVLFGSHPKVGLDTLALSEVVLKTLRTEEELEEELSSIPTSEDNAEVTAEEPPPDADVIPNDLPSSVEKPCAKGGFDVSRLQTSLCALCLRQENICRKRKESKDCLDLQGPKK
jgi:hypothetical protein